MDAEKVPSAEDAGLLGYQRFGVGPEPIAIMHEWLGDHTNYDPLLPYLDSTKFSFIFIDLRGYGLSKAMQGKFSVAEATDDVLHLMSALGYQVFHVVGHSMSAMVAQRVAMDASHRVESVIAVTPVAASGLKVDDAARTRMAAVISDDQAAKDAIAARTGNRYGNTWLSRKLAIARSAATPAAMHGYLDMITGTNFSHLATGLQVPVLAIIGEHDIPAYREESVRRLFSPIYPKFDLVACREAGHYPMLEAPVFLASHIERFVAANANRIAVAPSANDTRAPPDVIGSSYRTN